MERASVEVAPAPAAVPAPAARAAGWGRSEVVAWSVLGGMLLAFVPLFLCQGLYADFVNYQVYAQSYLHGGVPERDCNVFCKPPMMTWLLIGLYWVSRWRVEAVHALDLAFVTGIVWLLARWLKAAGLARGARVWFAVALFAFYFSTSDWCHDQPDTWMLLPALGALSLRGWKLQALEGEATTATALAGGVLEGVCWGLGCLFKPYVVVPGFLAWLVGTALIGRHHRGAGMTRRLIADFAGVVLGGGLTGAVWLSWLYFLGGLRPFLHDFGIWREGYYGVVGAPMGERLVFLFTQFLPWGLVHAVAIPVALVSLVRAIAVPGVRAGRAALLGVFYLGWLGQANFIQFQMDYHAVPAVFLALAVVAEPLAGLLRPAEGRFALSRPVVWGAVAVVAAAVAVREPLLYPHRLTQWPRCWAGSTPELQDELTCMDFLAFENRQWGSYWHQYLAPAHFTHLRHVAEYLRRQGVKDGDVTAYSMYPSWLYTDLDVMPSTRFPLLSPVIGMYPQKKQSELIRKELADSHQRFIVTDPYFELSQFSANPPWKTDKSWKLPKDFPEEMRNLYPWYEPVVFRSGPYFVHKLTAPVERIIAE